MTRHIISAILAFGILVISSPSFAADTKAGEAKFNAVCVSCHLPKGESVNPTYPRLAGQHAAYVITSLQAYKTGQRTGASAAQMVPFASLLTDVDIANIASYLESLRK